MNSRRLLTFLAVIVASRYERERAEYIEKLPKGMHSCKGLGKTEPDPKASVTIGDGVEIPLGEGITDIDKNSTLLYNEYPFHQNNSSHLFFFQTRKYSKHKQIVSLLLISFFQLSFESFSLARFLGILYMILLR